MIEPITVRLELEGMRYSILHAFSNHQQDIKSAVEQQVESAVNNFNWEKLIHESVAKCLRDIVETLFNDAKYELLKDKDLKAKVFEIFTNNFSK